MLLLILLFLSTYVMADDIKVIDSDTFTKTTVATVKVADVKGQIVALQHHQARVNQEINNLKGVLESDQGQIYDLQFSLDAVAKAFPAPANANWADDAVVTP